MAELSCFDPTCGAPIHPKAQVCPHCGKPQLLQGIYRVQGVLGRGGFGCVYDAIDTEANQRCAIKEIQERDEQSHKDAIKREVTLLLTNAEKMPFMPNMQAYWTKGSRHFIVMEYVDGATIDCIRPLPWSPTDVFLFLREVLGHLVKLHAVGIVHRDIKPTNMKYTKKNCYVLLDFGLATQGGNTILQALSPEYAPPEQFYPIRSNDIHTDARSDLYSLAATAYYLLTNDKPTRADIRMQGKPLKPLPSSIHVPVAFEKLLFRMLELDPQNRPESAHAAFAEINRIDPSTFSTALPDTNNLSEGSTVSQRPHITAPNMLEPSSLVSYQTLKPGKGQLASIAWAPDGRQLAVASALGFGVYDVQASKEIFFKEQHKPIRQVQYALNGEALVLATPDRIEMFQPESGKWLTPINGYADEIDCKIISAPQGHTLAVVAERVTTLWQADTQQAMATLREEMVSAVALNASGTILALATREAIKIWQLQADVWKPTPILPIRSAAVAGLSLSADGSLLAVASNHSVSVWRTRERRQVGTLEVFPEGLSDAALAPDGQTLATLSGGQVAIWRVATQKLMRVMEQRDQASTAIAFSPRGDLLAGFSDEQVCVWQVRDGMIMFQQQDFLPGLHSVAFSHDGSFLAAMGRRIHVWQLQHGKPEPARVLGGQSDGQHGVAFAPDGQLLASASRKGIELWRLPDGTLLQEIGVGAIQAHSIAFATPETLLNVSAGAIQFRKVKDGALIRTLTPDLPHEYDVALAANGQVLAAFADRMIEVWDCNGTVRWSYEFPAEIHSVALTPDGQRLAVALDEDIQVWSLDGKPRLLARRQESAHRIVFAPTGDWLALLRDKSILLWPVEQYGAALLTTLEGHNDVVYDAAFAPSGRMLASAAQDGTVRLWTWNAA